MGGDVRLPKGRMKAPNFVLSVFLSQNVFLSYNHMKDSWKPLEQIDFSDENLQQFHVDTRDFCVNASTEPTSQKIDIGTLSKYKDRFFFSSDEVKSVLQRYLTDSGGINKKWRLFSLEGLDDNWNLKYIRIVRTPHGLLIMNKEYHALKRSEIELPVKKGIFG